MFFPPEVTTQLISGAAAGFGQAFGQRLVPWVVKSWQWLFGSAVASEPMIREVALAMLLKSGVPKGCRLFLKRGETFLETTLPQLAPENCAGATLWLFPEGDVWQVARFATNGLVGQAEVGIEFAPESGFHCVMPTGGEFDHGWLSSLLQGAILGIVNTMPQESRPGLLLANPQSVSIFSQKLDESLRQHGMRCRGIRNVTGEFKSQQSTDTSDDSDFQGLATELSQIKTEKDWSRLVESLRAAGVPIDPSTTERLDRIRDSVLKHQVPPPEGVRQIAELTADAFQRAGIEQRDLQSWQVLSEKLGELPTEEKSSAPSPASIGVATPKKPSTWFVWNREEVDRRQLLFTKRAVKNCRVAYEQALTTLSDITALRQIRELKEQVTLIEDLLATVPPLNPPRAAMRVDKQVAKELVSAYADAVKTTEELAARTDNLLNLSSVDQVWTTEFQACRREASKLAQMVRDRRTIR